MPGKFIRDQDDHKPLRSIDLLTGYLNPSDNDLLFSEIITAKETPTAFLKNGGRSGPTATCIRYKEGQNGVATNKTFKRGDFVLLDDPTTPPIGRYPYAVVESQSTAQMGGFALLRFAR